MIFRLDWCIVRFVSCYWLLLCYNASNRSVNQSISQFCSEESIQPKLWTFHSFEQTKQTIDKLQTLVSTDGRFRNMREALHRCDPPCIPYLGMYLTDLSFIEEGTPNFTDDGLLNFSKMRMVSIRQVFSVSAHFCFFDRSLTWFGRSATSSKRHIRSNTTLK